MRITINNTITVAITLKSQCAICCSKHFRETRLSLRSVSGCGLKNGITKAWSNINAHKIDDKKRPMIQRVFIVYKMIIGQGFNNMIYGQFEE